MSLSEYLKTLSDDDLRSAYEESVSKIIVTKDDVAQDGIIKMIWDKWLEINVSSTNYLIIERLIYQEIGRRWVNGLS